MPRPKVILQSQFPYHVTARCRNKEWYKIPLSQVWKIMSDQLFFISRAYEVNIHSFVLMNNHFHMLITTPKANLSMAMMHFMRETTRTINFTSNRINQVYGGRHFRSIISTNHYYNHAYKYIYRNPVTAKIVRKCESYPYSSLAFKLGFQKATFPIAEDTLLFGGIEDTLKWLNTSPKQQDLKDVKWALSRATFRLPKNTAGKDEHKLESTWL